MKNPTNGAGTLAGEDRVVVDAPTTRVFAALCDTPQWSQWWPGVAVRRPQNLPLVACAQGCGVADAEQSRPDEPDEKLRPAAVVVDATRPLDLFRVIARPTRVRPDIGWWWCLAGDVDAHAEIWLEAYGDRTVIHHLSWWGAGRRATRLTVYRRSWRRGMSGLKAFFADEPLPADFAVAHHSTGAHVE